MGGCPNTQFSVAAHVLIYLAGAGQGRSVSSDELAESVNVSPVHIRRVLGPLREAGLLHSRAGVSGGWGLARPASRIHLDEVWDLVTSGPAMATHGPNPSCPVGRQVHGLLDAVQADVAAAIRDRLHARTVADLLAEVDPTRV